MRHATPGNPEHRDVGGRDVRSRSRRPGSAGRPARALPPRADPCRDNRNIVPGGSLPRRSGSRVDPAPPSRLSRLHARLGGSGRWRDRRVLAAVPLLRQRRERAVGVHVVDDLATASRGCVVDRAFLSNAMRAARRRAGRPRLDRPAVVDVLPGSSARPTIAASQRTPSPRASGRARRVRVVGREIWRLDGTSNVGAVPPRIEVALQVDLVGRATPTQTFLPVSRSGRVIEVFSLYTARPAGV